MLHEVEPLEQGLVKPDCKEAPQDRVSEGEEHPFNTQAVLHWTAFALLQQDLQQFATMGAPPSPPPESKQIPALQNVHLQNKKDREIWQMQQQAPTQKHVYLAKGLFTLLCPLDQIWYPF